jgi:hypothetical protein
MKPALAVFLFLAFSIATHAQTNFAMVGLGFDDAVELDLLSYSATSQEPCRATIGFQNVNGEIIGGLWTGWAPSGQVKSLVLDGIQVAPYYGDHPLVLPVVINASPTCIASAEIIEDAIEDNPGPQVIVAVPSYQGARAPVFGVIGVPYLDILQTTLEAGTEGCAATVMLETIGTATCGAPDSPVPCNFSGGEVDLSAGESTAFSTNNWDGGLLHPIVSVIRGVCNASVVVLDGLTLEPYTYYVPIEP